MIPVVTLFVTGAEAVEISLKIAARAYACSCQVALLFFL